MNTKILFLVLCVAALSSCSTAYKMGQTPDDVYFSPAKPQKEYVAVQEEEDRYVAPNRNNSRYNSRYDSYNDFDMYGYRNDRLLRMSIGNRMRLSAFDDYYWNDGFNTWKYNNYGSSFNNPWNSYYYWNNFYNPYNSFSYYNYNPYYYYPSYGNVVVVNPKSPLNPASRPRSFSPGGYTNNNYNNNNLYLDRNAASSARSRPVINSGNRYTNTNSNTNTRGLGNTMRRIFSSPDNNNSYYNNSNNSSSKSSNNNSYTPSRSSDAPVRTYTPSSSSSSSSSSGSSSSGSSGGGVSRPTRN